MGDEDLTVADLGRAVMLYPHGGKVASLFMDSVEAMQRFDIEKGLGLFHSRIRAHSGANICRARNLLVQHFLDETDAEWAWFCDTDMVFSDDALLRLLVAAKKTGAKIIGGLCCIVNESGLIPTLFIDDDDNITKAAYDFPDEAVVEVAATGTGFLLIHRDVLLDMQAARDGSIWGWFVEGERISQTGTSHWMGEDVLFCLNARALGHSVYVDCTTPIGHVKGNRTWWPSDIRKGHGSADLVPAHPQGGDE